MRGRKVLTEILTPTDDEISTIKISPCNLYIIYGLRSGTVKKYSLRSKVTKIIMDMYDPVHYLNFVNPQLLIAGSKNCSLMAHRLTSDGDWKTEMLHCGKTNLGSQELLNDWQGSKIYIHLFIVYKEKLKFGEVFYLFNELMRKIVL